MNTFTKQLLAAGLVCASCLPVWAEQSAEPPMVMPGQDGGNLQASMDRMLAAQHKSDQAAAQATTPAALGQQIDAVLKAAAKAQTDAATTEYYATQWKLLRLLPVVAYKTHAARTKIMAVSPAVKQFLVANEKTLDQLSVTYLRFRQPLGLRSEAVDQAAQKMGFQGVVDAGKGAPPTEGDLALPADGKPATVTAAEKARLAALETALKKLLAADPKEITADYANLWKTTVTQLEVAWFFQADYNLDPKLGEAFPETLKFLRSFNHGLGDLSRYEPMAADLGWNIDQLDDAAGLTPATGGRLRTHAGNPAAGGTVSSDGTSTPGNAGGEGDPGVGNTAPGVAEGNPGQTADGGASVGTPDNAAVEDWQAKLDAQIDRKTQPAAAQAADQPAGSLDDVAQKLADSLREMQQNVAKAKADNDAEAYFKAQWQLLHTLPELAYKNEDTRKAISQANDEMKSLARDNDATVGTLAKLFVRFKQKLGLRSQQVENIARRMGVKGNVNETKGAAAQTGNGDISLDPKDGKPDTGDGPETVTAQERYKIQVFETYLARLAGWEKSKAILNADPDFKAAAKNLEGAYFFQVLYKKDATLGTKYPNTLKFLQGVAGGLGDLRAYEDILKRNGWTIDDNGDLVRENGGDNNNENNPGNRPIPPAWRNGGNLPRGGAGGRGGGRGR